MNGSDFIFENRARFVPAANWLCISLRRGNQAVGAPITSLKTKSSFDVGTKYGRPYWLPGDLTMCVPPLPIPNRAVKAHCPDDTCPCEDWESRVRRDTNAVFLFGYLNIFDYAYIYDIGISQTA